MKNSRGYTLVELLAIVTVLSVIVGMSTVAFSQVQNSVLNKDYDNIISHIETSAEQFANDTGIYGTITVQDLIDAGYITPDDKTNIYNPIDNTSINCKQIDITYQNDEFVTEYQKDKAALINDGNCVVNENEQLLEICRIDGGSCVSIGNEWYTNDITVGVRYRDASAAITSANNVYLWKPFGSSDSTIQVERKGIVSVDVRFNDESLEYGRASKEIKIDKVVPEFTKVDNNKIYYKDEDSGINQICFFSDDTIPSTCATAMENSSTKDCATASENSRVIKTGATFACATDNAGNITNEPKGVLDKLTLEPDYSHADSVKTANGDNYASVAIKGTARNTDLGIQAYAFTSTNTVPTTWNALNSTTYEEITQTYKVTSNGTYYFWVKYGNGDTNKESITISNILQEVKTIDLIIDYENSGTVKIANSNNYSSIVIKGTAQNNYDGIKAYAFTTSSTVPTTWTNLDSTTFASISKTYNITDNTTYYFWVKYGNDTTNKASITITQLQTERIETAIAIDESNSGTKKVTNSNYYTAIVLKGTAINNTKGIKAYTFTTSSSTPSSWTSITLTKNEITKTKTVTSNATHYFWVKYDDDTTAKKSITIDQIVTSSSTTLSFSDRSSSTLTKSKTISGIKALGTVTVDNGSVSSSSLSGTSVTVTVTGGTTLTGQDSEVVTKSPTTANATSECSSYKCSNGGTVSGSKCVANKGSSYTLNTSPVQHATFTCSEYNKYTGSANAPSTSCATHYTKGTSVTYYRCSSSSCTPSNGTKLSCSPSCVYLEKSCTSNLSFYWIGSTTCTWQGDYNATCSSSEPVCPSSSYTLVSSTCYKCASGYTFNKSAKECRKTVYTDYSYWEYTVTINYYK